MKLSHPYLSLLLLLTMVSGQIYAQGYLGLKRHRIQTLLVSSYADATYKTTITETDNTLLLSTKSDSTVKCLDFMVKFDGSNRCYATTNQYDCERCYKEHLLAVLQQPAQEWKQVTDHIYFSRFRKKMVLVTDTTSGRYSYTIVQVNWDKTMYANLQTNPTDFTIRGWLQQFLYKP